MCQIIIRAKRVQRHFKTIQLTSWDEVYVKPQEEYRRTVRSNVKAGRSKQTSGGGMKLRHQPGPKDHQAGAQARGRSKPKARKTGPQPHLV